MSFLQGLFKPNIEKLKKLIATLLEKIARNQKRIESAKAFCGSDLLESQLATAASHNRGFSYFDFASSPNTKLELDASDVQKLSRFGLYSFRESINAQMTPLKQELDTLITRDKHSAALALLQICATEEIFPRSVRKIAIEYLVSKLGTEIIDDITPLLSDSNEFLRFHTANILGLIKSPRSIGALWEFPG